MISQRVVRQGWSPKNGPPSGVPQFGSFMVAPSGFPQSGSKNGVPKGGFLREFYKAVPTRVSTRGSPRGSAKGGSPSWVTQSASPK